MQNASTKRPAPRAGLKRKARRVSIADRMLGEELAEMKRSLDAFRAVMPDQEHTDLRGTKWEPMMDDLMDIDGRIKRLEATLPHLADSPTE